MLSQWFQQMISQLRSHRSPTRLPPRNWRYDLGEINEAIVASSQWLRALSFKGNSWKPSLCFWQNPHWAMTYLACISTHKLLFLLLFKLFNYLLLFCFVYTFNFNFCFVSVFLCIFFCCDWLLYVNTRISI